MLFLLQTTWLACTERWPHRRLRVRPFYPNTVLNPTTAVGAEWGQMPASGKKDFLEISEIHLIIWTNNNQTKTISMVRYNWRKCLFVFSFGWPFKFLIPLSIQKKTPVVLVAVSQHAALLRVLAFKCQAWHLVALWRKSTPIWFFLLGVKRIYISFCTVYGNEQSKREWNRE